MKDTGALFASGERKRVQSAADALQALPDDSATSTSS